MAFDFASAASGLGALAGAFGGGGGGGGAVVGGPSPAASYGAAYIQSQAAQAAAAQAKQAVNDAILSINKNYSQARYDVQPYRTQGVQALNQLNQYLGLDAYNPGAAPTAPKENTVENALGKISKADVQNYVLNNSTFGTNSDGKFFGYYNYMGAGADDPNVAGAMTPGGDAAGIRMRNVTKSLSTIMNSPAYSDAIKRSLAEDYVKENQDLYDQSVVDYNRNKDEWQQNLDWYNQYQAEGPLTSEQVVAKISGQPGYAAEMQQGVDAIGRSAAARGQVGSGNILKELTSFGQNTLSKYYNNTLDRLAGQAANGQQAAMASSQNSQQLGQLIGNAQIGLGDTMANATLAGGQARAQGLLSANQQYKVIGGGGGGMK